MLCEIVEREGCVPSMTDSMNVRAVTALFTFLHHMEILHHYILTKSSVLSRERKQGYEAKASVWIFMCQIIPL